MIPDQTNSSKAKRDLLEKYLRGEIPSSLESRNGIAPRESGNIAPLSVTQQQVWLHHHIVPEDVPVYNETLTIHRTGPLDPAVLERCLREIVRRHEIWRTTFDGGGEELVQIVHPAPQTFPLQVMDLSQVPEAGRVGEALRLATEDARRPFDLKTGPLLRALLVSLSDQQHRIYMTLHHLIFDAVTAYRVLVPEVEALYEAFSAGQASPLPEPRLQYADFACWQRRNLSPLSSEHEAYWRKQMARELPLGQWPNDRPRPAVQTHHGAIERFAFPATLVQRLRVLSQQAGVSLYMTLLAGFVAVLKRYTEQDEIVIGSLTAGRNRVELEQMMGHFVNPLTLRFDVSGNPTFRELQLRVRNVVLEGLAHESVPFSQVVKLTQQRNDPSRHPLFQIIFSQQPRLQHVAPGWELITEEVSNGGSALDLTVVIDDRGDAVSGPITYNPDLFDVSTIRRAVEHWRTLLEGAADDASRGILDLPILTERERNQFLFDWNRTALEFPRSKTLHELFEGQVKKTPEAVAITFGDQSLTYQELNQRADQVARHLQSLGVGPDVPVGLFVERSFEMMVGVLGVLKAGGTCLPLDPGYPAERLSFMLGETQAPVVLTQSGLWAQLPTHNAEVVCLDSEQEFRGEDVPPAAVPAASATNIAYIIYTSGSTGQPKGVRVTHFGLVNSTLARTAYYRETLRSFLLLSSFTFDSSLAGIFWTLSVGGTLVLPPDSSQWELDSLSFLIEKHQVSHLLCVPSLYQTLIESGSSECLASLKVAIVAGEACPVDLVKEHYSRLPRAALYNEYGPTEATVWCSAYRCEPQAEAIRVPIGRPIANTQLYVLDSHLQMVPVGVPGELYVGGAGVAGGYWNRPDLTTEKFISNPFSSTPGACLYKTGDLARFLPDGNIEYLGRVDHQVKIRGFRIELGEIEAALARHPGVREAVVVAREDAVGEKRLVAYYTASNANAKATGVTELRAHLSGKLPDYMVPAAYVRMERMPLTANGKLDRKALPMPKGDAYAVRGYEAPQGEIETRLAEIWVDVLKIERVGRHDNFFELGGHSLLAVVLIERIRRRGLAVNVRTLFMTPTLAGLAVAAADKGANLEVPENRIPIACEAITPQMLPLVALSQEEIDCIVNSVPGGARNVQDIYPLAPLQEGILFHHLLGGEGDPYLVGGLLSFDTRKRLDGYVAAMQKVIDRHDILRTAVLWEGLREPVQVVQRKALLSTEEVKLDAAGGDASQQLYARFDPRHYRISVQQAPLLRMHIAYDEQKDRWLMMELLHHLAGDHVTWELMQEEVHAHLLKQAHTLPAPQPFRNLVAQARLGMSQAEHQAYFQKLLGDVDESTAPFGLLDVQGDGTGIEEASTVLDSVLAERIRERARRLGVSAASVCHLAWAQVLARVSGRDDVVFGTVLLGRLQGGQDADRVMGLFINTLPVRIRIGEEGVEASVRRVHAQLADLLQHEHASLALAQRCSGVAAPTPLFSALLNYRRGGAAAPTRSEERKRAWEGMELLHRDERSSYPFSMSVDDVAEGFSLTAQTVASVGAKRACEYMRAALEALAEALEKEPGRSVRTLDVLPVAERDQVLLKFNDTAVEYPKEKCVHELFEEQVEKSPGDPAVVFEDTSLTYAELNGRANQLAHYLRELGVKPEKCVGICVERGLEMVVGLLAILKAGGTYVPLDPRHPAQRLHDMLEDSAPAVLLTQREVKKLFSGLGAALPVLDLADAAPSWRDKPTTNLDRVSVGLMPEHLAYVIYTSGSTGQPKGVRVLHRGLVNSTLARSRFYPERLQSFLLLSSFTFDSSLAGIFWTLSVGGTLVLPPDPSRWELDSLSSLIEKHQVSHLLCVPGLYKTLLESSPMERLASLQVAIVAGETCPLALVQEHYSRLARAALYNEYGPTEATVWCSAYRCEPQAESSRVPIGRPIANTQLYVLDSHLQMVPVGVPGELYVGGAGVAGGYWKRPDLTAEKFIANPFSSTPGARLYKTGDRALFLPDGNLEYLGRVDHQVKMRGFRIELGEIEAALASHRAVREAVVVAREDEPGEKRLVAYYTAWDGNGQGSGAGEMRSHLSSKLPEYMVPAAFVRMERMPLTSNGKLDRKALPMPEGDAYVMRGYEAPQGEIERRLAGIWADVLKVERVGRQDNFFELGGHSLLAVMLIERMRRLGLRVNVRTLFLTPSLAGLAAAVDKGVSLEIPENRIPMQCEVITPQMLPLVKLSQEEIARIVNCVPGGVANVQDIYPLGPLQEGILFHHLLGGEGDPYLLGSLLSFDTRTRMDGYVEAMQKVIDRHDILRTAVIWEGLTEPVQVVQRKALLPVQEVTLDASGEDASAQLYARFDPRHHRIDVGQAPLLRVHIAYDEQNDRWLMVELLHHLAGDHVTLEVMEQEVQAFLLKQVHNLPAPKPFRNLVAQARLGMSERDHQEYFRKLLGDVDQPTAPFGLLDVQGDGTGIEEAHALLDSVLAGRIRERARRLGVSAASVCHLAWAQVLARVSGRDDVVFGTVLFGRMQASEGADRVMGLFINTLPVRIQIGEEGVEASVRLVHAQLAELLHHEHASLALTQRCSGVAAPTPLFSALLNYRHSGVTARTSPEATERAGEGIKCLRRDERTSYPFTLSVDDLAEGFCLTAQTAASVGAKRVCAYMQTALEGLVEALEKAPGSPMRTLSVLPVAEREQVLFGFNDTRVEYPSEKCIHEFFEEQVEKSPENTAVVFQDLSLTYAELNGRANQLAHYLRELDVRPDTRVGICVERGPEMVVGLLAILKAGGAYVPLDPTYPAERLRYMLEDSAPAALLTQGHLSGRFTDIGDTMPVLSLDGGAPPWQDQPVTDPDRAGIGLTPEHLAYVIYTSGSTGMPKGVAVEHRALVNYLHWALNTYNPESAVVSSSLSFDATVTSLYGPLLRGGTIRLLLERGEIDGLESQVQQERTCGLVKITPVHLDVLGQRMLSEGAQTAVRVFVIGGEALSSSTVRLWRRIQPDVRLVNEYGPTEATVGCITYDVPRKADLTESVPIGRPIANARVYILDGRGEPVPVGVGGELYIGGAGIARGYWNRPALTAERFLKDPFVEEPGARMYRTGDLGKWLADGVIEYLGRNDFQVKIRGFRIELGEIEAALLGHPMVREAVVVAREDEPGEKRLVAYYTAWDGNGQGSGAGEMRSHLSSKLPEYMVPAAYVRMERMPLTSNGKLDRKALPTPEGDAYGVRGYEAPQGEMETGLAGIWAEVLRVERVGRYDNFFALGGHSLLAMQVMARIRHIFDLELPVRSIFERPTITGLAGELQKTQLLGFKARAHIVQLRSGSAGASPSRQALLAQLDNLSAAELQNLLQRVLDEKRSA